MFNNIGLHTELLTPVAVILLVIGGILGYGSKKVLNLIYENPSEKAIIIFKLVGLILVFTGVIIILKR